MQTISQQKTGRHLCSVKSWGKLIQRIHKYPDITIKTPVNVVLLNNKLVEITDRDITQTLKATVTLIGPEKLGFTKDEVGTHSIRTSTAMSLFLARVGVVTIMLLGRWKSDSFLRYIREHVLEALVRVSFRMANQKDFFTATHSLSETNMKKLRSQVYKYRLPSAPGPKSLLTKSLTDQLNLRATNTNSFAKAISPYDPNLTLRHARQPCFHVWAWTSYGLVRV